MINTVLLSPTMENADLWQHYISHRNLRRKYLIFNNERIQIKLSAEAEEFVKERKRAKSRAHFNRYLDKHRDEYNKIYRERYHILKARNAKESDDSDHDVLVIELTE